MRSRIAWTPEAVQLLRDSYGARGIAGAREAFPGIDDGRLLGAAQAHGIRRTMVLPKNPKVSAKPERTKQRDRVDRRCADCAAPDFTLPNAENVFRCRDARVCNRRLRVAVLTS